MCKIRSTNEWWHLVLINPGILLNGLGLAMYKILTLDFGHAKFLTSDTGSSDVKDIILERLPNTILLFTTATAIVSLLGILLGAIAASKVNSKIDKITSGFAIISSSFPVWWVGLIMIFLFAFVYPIFPARANARNFYDRSWVHCIFVISYGITVNHSCSDWIWVLGLSC
ncbi:Oligopeptide transport system permease protein OppB [Candidatus Nitrosotalea sp. TS]|nr:Oligopeptide transport system permease protein OppB [Candidatus Nitrosotalea sp. TS]